MADFVESGLQPGSRAVPNYVIAPMVAADVEAVLVIERASFRFPWPAQAFYADLALPYAVWRVARTADEAGRPPRSAPETGLVARRRSRQRGPDPLLGYAGFQVILDEGHIMNVAVHPDCRRRGIGELLLLDLYDQARARGVQRLTLEVRASNVAAQELYRKYGFQVEGRRWRYYGDGEDALIMWTGRLDRPDEQARWETLRCQWQQRWAAG